MHRILLAAPPDGGRTKIAAAIRHSGMGCDARTSSARRLRTLFRERPYDCVVVSPNVPGLDAAIWRKLAAAVDPAPLLVYLEDARDPVLMETLWAGARGAILADRPQQAPAAIRAALEGHVALPREATATLLSTLMRQHQLLSGEGPISRLTDRERQVLQLMQEGRTTAEIAHELQVAPVTVRSHIAGILHKLSVSDRQAAIDLTTHDSDIESASRRR